MSRSPINKTAWLAVGFVVLAALVPITGNDYFAYMACLIAINVIATLGLNITVGYAGLLSIGHSAFVGVGAYVCGLLWLAHVPMLIDILAGGVASFAVGLVFGLPAVRIKGVHLAISTLAAQYSLYFIFQRWTSVTHGDNGLTLPQATLFGLKLDSNTKLYYLILAFTVILALAAANLFRTRVGRAFIAIRERDYAAQVLGIDVSFYKLLAFGVGAGYAGIAGGLLAFFLRLVNPDQFVIAASVFYLTAVLVGGRGSILGSILGALFMTLVPELMRTVVEMLSGSSASVAGVLATWREFIFGALIVGFLLLDPRGLVGIIARLGGRVEYRG